MEAITKYPWGKGRIVWTRDATTNDSDKSFTVPAGNVWDLRGIYIDITSTATVGNRRPVVDITDGTNVLFTPYSTTNETATQRGVIVFGFDSVTDDYAVSGPGNVNTNIGYPPCLLPAGYVVRVYDVNAIDAAADDLTVVLHYIEYDA